MLDPEYIKTVTDELENYFYDLETDILSDIAERIRLNAGKMTSTAQYQLEQLKALGVVDNRVNSYLSKALKKSDKEVENLISESAYKSVEADNVIFKEAYDKKLIASFSYNRNNFKDLISKGIAATTKDIKNICQTTAQTSRKQLTSAMNMAYLQVSSGAFSPDQAVENAVLKLMKEGLDWIDYKSGTHRHLDSSIRQALRTSINQTALKCQDQNFEALGGNLVEVSSHLGARPSHAQWQGKIYWRKEKYKNYSNFEESTGYGKIDGLGGVNCRHSYFPYFPGLSTKSFEHYSKKENEELYDLQQQQRYNERKIREWKRRQKVKSSAGLDTSKETTKVREWSQRNKKLIDSDSRLKRNYGREKINKSVDSKNPYYLKEKNHFFGSKYKFKNVIIERDSVILGNNDGVEFIYPKKYDKSKQIIEPRLAMTEFDKVPLVLRKNVKMIEFLDIYNPNDEFWEKEYNIKNFISFATAGNNRITFWRNGDMSKSKIQDVIFRTYCHESAHILDKKGILSKSDDWIKAIAKDKEYPTEYAQSSLREDFAESVAEYLIHKKDFKTRCPNRYKIIKKILGD